MRQLAMEEPNGEVGERRRGLGRALQQGRCNPRPVPHPTQSLDSYTPRGGSPSAVLTQPPLPGLAPPSLRALPPRPRPAWLEPTLMEARSHRSTDI